MEESGKGQIQKRIMEQVEQVMLKKLLGTVPEKEDRFEYSVDAVIGRDVVNQPCDFDRYYIRESGKPIMGYLDIQGEREEFTEIRRGSYTEACGIPEMVYFAKANEPIGHTIYEPLYPMPFNKGRKWGRF